MGGTCHRKGCRGGTSFIAVGVYSRGVRMRCGESKYFDLSVGPLVFRREPDYCGTPRMCIGFGV